MLCTETEPTPRGPADDDWHPQPAAGEVAHLRGLGDDLIERDTEELREHDLDHRAEPARRCADRRTEDRGLRDRRVPHPIAPEFFEQPGRDLEDAPGVRNVFAEEDYRRVRGHLVS